MSTQRESTLTAPSDRNVENKFSLDHSIPPLTNEQTSAAMKCLNNTSYVDNFPQVERRFADPPIHMQHIGLISFIPAKGATPNEQGIFGFAKLRGNYATEAEANESAERIIRSVDSYHQIYHTYVGRPFPLTNSSDYSKEVSRVDLQKEMTSSISEDIRKKREKEQHDIEEIKNREKELLADVQKKEENKDDFYTTLRVKKAQLTWTYVETEKKLQQMAGLIAKARHEIEELDRSNPDLKESYYNRYLDARRQAGLNADRVANSDNFMKYMVEDVTLPAVDKEYNEMYGSKHWDY